MVYLLTAGVFFPAKLTTGLPERRDIHPSLRDNPSREALAG
jgi:hypothetical protein